jgi:glutaredoxin
LFIFSSGFTQQQDINVFEKKEGNKNIVFARNIGKVPYLVTLNITASGMEVSPSLKVESLIQPGYMKEMATLVPKPGVEWSYGYEVAFVEYRGEAPKTEMSTRESMDMAPVTPPPAPKEEISLSSAPIIVYTKPGCGRGTFVKKELKSKGVAFEEVDVSGTSPEVNDMWAKLREGGFSGGSVTMPVVRVNGKYHYNIKDMSKFVGDLGNK